MSDHCSPLVIVCIALGICLVIALLIILVMIWLYMSNIRPHQRPEETHMNHNREETFSTRGNGEARINSLISRNNGTEIELRIGATRFTQEMLARATENFSMNSRLGEGGLGVTYRGFIEDMNMCVAIKRIQIRGQGIQMAKNEAAIGSMLRHKNLVRFIGWCHEENEFLLVHEYLENGSLDFHLHGEGRFLDWRTRYRIVQGIASALHYLHEELPHFVLHRDIKPRNVLLDRDFNAKLGGFELAALIKDDADLNLPIAGTFGYLDPHVFRTGMPVREADIFSFGVVALEISCGRKPIEQGNDVNMLHWARELYRTGDLRTAADPKLRGEFKAEEMDRLLLLGLLCSHPDIRVRPSMRKVINVLNFDAPLPTLLPDPLFSQGDEGDSDYTVSIQSDFDELRSNVLQQTQDPTAFETATMPVHPKISQSQATFPTSQHELH